MRYDDVKERALVNFEILLQYWGVDYKRISPYEYDFRNPRREDRNFGACRFNIQKGRGSDFAGARYTTQDFARLGAGFDKDDFTDNAGLGAKSVSWGFDIISLCQKLYLCGSYADAAKLLESQLADIEKNPNFIRPAADAAEKRRAEEALRIQKNIHKAQTIWGTVKPVRNTLAHQYLENRYCIGGMVPKETLLEICDEPSLGFHHGVHNAELNRYIPCFLFKVQEHIEGPLKAVHRIYLNSQGGKAKVDEPKMAVGSIKGNGIWLGKKNSTLCIAEGPEEAIALRFYGFPFVVSTVYATNYANLKIPMYVEDIALFPDNDEAGKINCEKALEAYKLNVKKITVEKNFFANCKRGNNG